MFDAWSQLFDTRGFSARWHCGRWSDLHGWVHIGADVAIFIAYAAILLTLVYFVQRRKDIPYSPVFWLLSAFIFMCGFTHLIEASLFWQPWHRLSALAKVITAGVSWVTVVALMNVAPKALTLPGLAKLNTELERRVEQRTHQLSAALREREILLQEVHHRVKNNLQVIASLINLQVRSLDGATEGAALIECQTRVRAIASIHEQLYQSKDYANVPFVEYVRRLSNGIVRTVSASPEAISVDLAMEEVSLPVDVAIPCGLLLNELITNALKHAFPDGRPGRVRIELARLEGGHVRLAVADDGVGLPHAFDAEKAGTLGLRLVVTLAEQLGARLEVVSAGGACFSVTFTEARGQWSAVE